MNTILFPAVSSFVSQAIALTEKYEENDQTGDGEWELDLLLLII